MAQVTVGLLTTTASSKGRADAKFTIIGGALREEQLFTVTIASVA
jgi:hypothetical protein